MSRDHNVVNISKPGLVVSSDEHLCSPCETDGRRQAANHYCETCSEYFCNSCRNEHKSFKISKDHKIWSTTAPRQDQTVTGGLQTSPSEGLSKLSIGHHPTLTGMGLPSQSVNSLPSQSVNTAAASSGTYQFGNVLNLKLKSSRKVYIKQAQDQETPSIASCEFLQNGELLLLDHLNYNLIMLDKTLAVKDSFSLYPKRPRDVSALDENTVIVTCPRDKMMQYIHIYPEYTVGSRTVFDMQCYGVYVASGIICVTCHDNNRKKDNFTPGEIRVLDLRGNELKRLGGEKDGKLRFTWPDYVAVSSDGSIIYVSDQYNRTITAMSPDGVIIFQYRSDDLQDRSLYVDSECNILVCGYGSHNAQVITATGKKYKNLLISSDNIWNPDGIAYRPSDGTLVVGCCRQDELRIFKLE